MSESVSTPFATVEQALEDVRRGRMVVVVDDENRENEGDLTLAAQFATPEAINFMAMHARGLICLCLTEDGLEAYGLQVTEQVPIEVAPDDENLRYLRAKREKLGHRLHHQDLKFEPDAEA